jgi:hypothetical protein
MKLKNSYQDSFEIGNSIKLESQINGLKSVLKEVVVIGCKDNASKQKYSEELISKLGEDYEVSLPESKGPLLIRLGFFSMG